MALNQIQFERLKNTLASKQLETVNKQEQGGVFDRMKGQISKAGSNVSDAISGTGQYSGQTPLSRGFQATSEAFNAIPKVGYEALPEMARKGLSKVGEVVGKGFGAATNRLSETSSIQELMMLAKENPQAGKALDEALKVLSASGQISGNILLTDQASKLAQAGVNKGLDLGGKALEKTGQAAKTIGEKTYKSAYNLTKQEAELAQASKIKVKFLEQELKSAPKGSLEAQSLAEQITKAKGASPTLRADTAFQKGIMGTEKQIGVQSGVEKMGLWKNKIEPALRGSKDVITKEQIFSKAEQRIASEIDPSRKADLQNALESVKQDYLNTKSFSILDANKVKTSLDKFTPSKIFKGQDVANELKTIKADMADAIREATYSSLKDANIKTAYRDYANLKQLEEVGIKALTEAGTKGGFGNFWSTVYDALLTPVKTVGGKVLYRVGDKLEFVGSKGIKTFGDHLNDVGFKFTPIGDIPNKQGGFVKIGNLKEANIRAAEQLDNSTLLKTGGKNFDKSLTTKELEKIDKGLNFPGGSAPKIPRTDLGASPKLALKQEAQTLYNLGKKIKLENYGTTKGQINFEAMDVVESYLSKVAKKQKITMSDIQDMREVVYLLRKGN